MDRAQILLAQPFANYCRKYLVCFCVRHNCHNAPAIDAYENVCQRWIAPVYAMFMQFDHKYGHSAQQAMLGFCVEWKPKKQRVRHHTRSQAGHGIPAITADVLRQPADLRGFEQQRWRWNKHYTHRAERRNAAKFNLAQVANLALRHMRSGLFDRVTCLLALDKNHWMARLTVTDGKHGDAVWRPFLQFQIPGELFEAALICRAHLKLWQLLSSYHIISKCESGVAFFSS